jgi:hypothetical protein
MGAGKRDGLNNVYTYELIYKQFKNIKINKTI